MPPFITRNQRDKLYLWMYENLDGMSWLALLLVISMLVFLATAMTIAYRQRSVVMIENKSGHSLYRVALTLSHPSSREPRHVLPEITSGQQASFIVYPQAVSQVRLTLIGAQGRLHQWQGAEIQPTHSHLHLVIDASEQIQTTL
jgi:hypothetical protein